MIRRRPRSTGPLRTAFAALAALAATAGLALQWDLTAGEYHTHLLSTDKGFELHLHDKATHGVVDTTRGKVVATLLSGGKREDIPLQSKQAGILAGSRPLQGEWTLLFRVEMPGRKPTQLRYSSRMKPGSQDVAAGRSHDGHDHGHDHPKKR